MGCGAFAGRPGWRNASYRYEVTVYAPSTGAVEVNRVTDPYSLALTTNSERSVLVDLDDPVPQTRRLEPAEEAGAAQAGVLDHLRVPRARLLDQRRDGARGPSRHLSGLHRSRQRRDAPPASTGPIGAEHRAPAPGQRHRHHRGAAIRAAAAGLRPGRASRPTARSSRPASAAIAGQDGFNWGYDPLHYTTPEGSYATNPEGTAANRASSAGWCRASTGPGCGWSSTWSTTTPRRPGRIRSRSSTGWSPATTSG